MEWINDHFMPKCLHFPFTNSHNHQKVQFWQQKHYIDYFRAFFWTLFRQINSTRVGGFRVFFGIWPEFFQDFARVLSFFTNYTLSFFGYGIYSMEYVIFMSNKECIMDFHWKKLLFHKSYFCNVDSPFYFNFKTDEVLKSFEEIDFLAFAL